MDGFNPKIIPIRAKQFQNKERTLVLHGDESAFRIHVADSIGKEILLNEGSISREITIEEAVKLSESPHCQNQPLVKAFLKAIDAL